MATLTGITENGSQPSSRRDLLYRFFPKKINFLDAVNVNVDFIKIRTLFRASTPSFANRSDMHRYVSKSIVEGGSHDFLEFGVWKGESIQLWTELNKNPETRFFGFDTFTGLPEDWTAATPAGTFSTNGNAPPITDSRVQFIKGVFQETVAGFLEKVKLQKKLIVHVDCDLYSSTLFVLATLNNYLKPGSIIIFDDFYSLLHEFKAFVDYNRSFGRPWKPLAHVRNCVQTAIQVEA